MSYHSPTPWRTEVYSPAFASIVDAGERAVVEKMFKDDAAFIVTAVNAYSQAVEWAAKCKKCHDEGLDDPNDCKFYGEPKGCNAPVYGLHPSAMPPAPWLEKAEVRQDAVGMPLTDPWWPKEAEA